MTSEIICINYQLSFVHWNKCDADYQKIIIDEIESAKCFCFEYNIENMEPIKDFI
jgi:hypothetical protein